MEPWSYELTGRFDEHAFESKVLEGNALDDPHVRPLWVYVPPGYDDDSERRYPSIYVIQGLTGQLDGWRNRTPFRKNFPELVDELFAKGDSPPAILVWGARDRLVPLKDGFEYARRLRAPIRVLPASGHLVVGELPEACAAALEGFLDRVGEVDELPLEAELVRQLRRERADT